MQFLLKPQQRIFQFFFQDSIKNARHNTLLLDNFLEILAPFSRQRGLNPTLRLRIVSQLYPASQNEMGCTTSSR